MALPNSRNELKQYCLRKLGAPVIEINVDNNQIEDRIDEALNWWWDYHYSGSEKQYYKVSLTAEDIANKYVTLPANIIGAIRIFDIGQALQTNSIFNINYQIALNDLYTLTSISMVPYYMTLQHITFLQEILVGRQPIRYNRINNKVHIDMDWEKFTAGQYLVLECYSVIDPEEYTSAYKDRWLLKYTTALIKKQWGDNLKKFGNMQLPGGIVFNGQKIYDEAVTELKEIEDEIIHSYSIPVSDLIG